MARLRGLSSPCCPDVMECAHGQAPDRSNADDDANASTRAERSSPTEHVRRHASLGCECPSSAQDEGECILPSAMPVPPMATEVSDHSANQGMPWMCYAVAEHVPAQDNRVTILNDLCAMLAHEAAESEAAALDGQMRLARKPCKHEPAMQNWRGPTRKGKTGGTTRAAINIKLQRCTPAMTDVYLST